MPVGDYDVAVFENLFPSMNLTTQDKPQHLVPSAPATGVCEVVVFTQDPDSSLGGLPLSHFKLVLEVIAERTLTLGKNENIKYVMPFENRGVEMGVTLHHPHGQIYAYSFLPPVQSTILNSMKEYFSDHSEGLLERFIKDEVKEGKRIIAENEHAIAFIPTCARYPYEMWVAPKKAHQFLHQLSDHELSSLARVLKTVLLKYDKLWDKPFPYLMTLFQAPTDNEDYSYAHMHFLITPPYRSKERLKFLAGTELGAGVFVNDSLPEEKAAELQAVEVEINDE
jgi:UDPglucose--hexose-1-phosphate uridylyltransferase